MMFDDIFSPVDTMHQRVRRTDIERQQRPRLRIASRGKNECTYIVKLFLPSDRDIKLVVLSTAAVAKFQGKLPQRGR